MSDPFVPPPIPATPPTTPPASYLEFAYFPQFSMDLVGVVIHVAGVPADADGAVQAAMYVQPWPGTSPSPSPIFTVTATHPSTGVYEVQFQSAWTAVPGWYRIDWTFNLASVPEIISSFIEIGQAAPAYDYLPLDMRALIDEVLAKFADGFDSPFGGPNLRTYYQSKFGRGRVAQLCKYAIEKLNVISQPRSNYTIDGANGTQEFPLGTGSPAMPNFYALLNCALTIEVIKHLQRSYVEDPDLTGDVKARLTRRDYLQRWGEMLRNEQDDFKSMLDSWKISQMFKGQPRVLASGGVYGNYGPTRLAGSAAARPRYWSRFF